MLPHSRHRKPATQRDARTIPLFIVHMTKACEWAREAANDTFLRPVRRRISLKCVVSSGDNVRHISVTHVPFSSPLSLPCPQMPPSSSKKCSSRMHRSQNTISAFSDFGYQRSSESCHPQPAVSSRNEDATQISHSRGKHSSSKTVAGYTSTSNESGNKTALGGTRSSTDRTLRRRRSNIDLRTTALYSTRPLPPLPSQRVPRPSVAQDNRHVGFNQVKKKPLPDLPKEFPSLQTSIGTEDEPAIWRKGPERRGYLIIPGPSTNRQSMVATTTKDPYHRLRSLAGIFRRSSKRKFKRNERSYEVSEGLYADEFFDDP
jgi:hypothetical protein